jgi:hypothetical protein
MTGAPLRFLAGIVSLATLLSGCAPEIRLDAAATSPPVQTSSAPPAARKDFPASLRTQSPSPTSVPAPPPVP